MLAYQILLLLVAYNLYYILLVMGAYNSYYILKHIIKQDDDIDFRLNI